MSKQNKSKEMRELRVLIPENNICINCASKAPGYICLSFGTFVCTKCAGVHRSLQHNIRSITLSTLTDAEMELMRAGGNSVAARVWLASWREEDFPRPKPDDELALKAFIKAAYIDQRWKAGSSTGGISTSATNAPTLFNFGPAAVNNFSSPILTPSNTFSDASSDFNFNNSNSSDRTQLGSHGGSGSAKVTPSLSGNQSFESHGVPLSPGSNGLDLISWEEQPPPNSMAPMAPQSQPERRPVYQVQSSAISPIAAPPPSLTSPISIPNSSQLPKQAEYFGSPTQDKRIEELQNMLAEQQRAFQQQMEQQYFHQKELERKLSEQTNQRTTPIQANVPNTSTFNVPPSIPTPTDPSTPAPNGPPIYALGPTGQLVQLHPTPKGYVFANSQTPQTPSVGAPAPIPQSSNAISFTPATLPNGQIMSANPNSPLMTNNISSAAQLPPGSIGPHYVPAPGGGYQAVYMVPSGTLPPNAAAKKQPFPPQATQKPIHGPVKYASTGQFPGYSLPSNWSGATNHSQSMDEDFQLALRLQQEEEQLARSRSGSQSRPTQVTPPKPVSSPPGYIDITEASYIANDEALARQLAVAEISDEE